MLHTLLEFLIRSVEFPILRVHSLLDVALGELFGEEFIACLLSEVIPGALLKFWRRRLASFFQKFGSASITASSFFVLFIAFRAVNIRSFMIWSTDTQPGELISTKRVPSNLNLIHIG